MDGWPCLFPAVLHDATRPSDNLSVDADPMKITLIVGVSTEEQARELRGHLGHIHNIEIVSGSPDDLRR
jgi:hypothetical protein